jgi:hypothetical protein
MVSADKKWGYRYHISRKGFKLALHAEPQLAFYGSFDTKEGCEASYKKSIANHAFYVCEELRSLSDMKVLIKRLKKYKLDEHARILEDIQAQLSKFEQEMNLLNNKL